MNNKERDGLTMELAGELLLLAETFSRKYNLLPIDAAGSLWLAIGCLAGTQSLNQSAEKTYATIISTGKPLYIAGFKIGKNGKDGK